MKQRLKAIFKGPVVFYPLLFAAFPILFLYAHNISEASASQILAVDGNLRGCYFGVVGSPEPYTPQSG